AAIRRTRGQGGLDPRGPRARALAEQQPVLVARAVEVGADRAAVARRGARHRVEHDLRVPTGVRGQGDLDPRGPRARALAEQQPLYVALAVAVIAARAAVAHRRARPRVDGDARPRSRGRDGLDPRAPRARALAEQQPLVAERAAA